MWFSLFAVVLILAVTFYQGLLGLFSASINFFLTVLAAALAFGLYEDVYFSYLIDRQPDDGRGIALMAIFLISLLVMRVVIDLIIKDNMHFPMYVDRAGGGIFGFLTAMIIIGTLAAGIQMLPFPYQWLGYSRYAMFNDDTGEAVSLTPKEDREKEEDVLAKLDLGKVNFVRKNLWLNPDGFAVALVSHLSDNALAGRSSYARMNPDLLGDLYWTRFTQVGQKTTLARKADAIKVEACWELEDDALFNSIRSPDGKTLTLKAPGKNGAPESGNRFLAVRASLTADAADDGTNYRFTTGQVQLAARGSGGRTEKYQLVGVNAGPDVPIPKDRPRDLYYRLSQGESVARAGGQFDFVFEVPKDAEPWFIEFRRNARAEIKGVDKDAPPTAFSGRKKTTKGNNQNADDQENADDSGTSGGTQNGSSSNSGSRRNFNRHENADPGAEARTGGRTKRVTSDEEGSFFSNDLPFELTDYTVNDVEVRGDKVIGGGGRIIARFEGPLAPAKGSKNPLKTFDVPDNMRLLQLSTTRLHPGSTYGQAIDFAGQIKNVAVFDDQNQEYRAIGVWAVATVSGQRTFELVYFDQTTRMSSAAVPRTDKIRRDDMQRDYLYYFLFEIPPGKRIVRFLAGRGSGEDLTAANLVAPR